MNLAGLPSLFRSTGGSIRVNPSDDYDDVGIKKSSTSSRSRPSMLSLGRVLNILLDAEPKELETVRGQLKLRLQPKGSVGQAALALINHVMGTNSTHTSVEQIFVPILEHAVKSKDHNYRKRAVSILAFLLEKEEVGEKAAGELAAVAWRHQTNNRVKLGWCVVVREIVQAWSGQAYPESPLHSAAFPKLVACTAQLDELARTASVQEENKKVPTRLSIVAADCMLAVTKAIATGTITNETGSVPKENLDTGQLRRPLVTPIETSPDDIRSGNARNNDKSTVPSTSNKDLFFTAERRNMALWDQLDNLVSLVTELYEWNYRSRPLYAKGLEVVQKRLRSLAQYRDSLRNEETKEGDISIGAEVLVACWQHYGGLLMTEDKSLYSHPQPVLQHWLGALQYFMQESDESITEEETRKSQEMRGYALACLALTIGRLDARRLEIVLEEFEPQLLNALFSQLRGADNAIIELAVGILRAIFFRPSVSASVTAKEISSSKMETVVPMLLEMLDNRDTTARAVVLLVAEYFASNPEAGEFERLFSRLDAEDSLQRRNALDVLTELFSICTRNVDVINSPLSQTIASHLFKRLGDTELTNRAEASALFASLDPSFTLPTLVELIYSPDAQVRSAASAGVLSILTRKSDQSKVIVELVDCITKFANKRWTQTDAPKRMASDASSDTSALDIDRVIRLVPQWASKVKNWSDIVHLLLKKMFDEPRNGVLPRFLSSISPQLAENSHVLFPLLVKKFHEQSRFTEALITEANEDDREALTSNLLFERLSPLLVLKVLPLRAFSNAACKDLYGGLASRMGGSIDLNGGLDTDGTDCIAYHLLNRACGTFEFEDVRKVAAEIAGRLVPEMMLPLVTVQMEDATKRMELRRVKACLYIVCTSFVVRAKDVVNHSSMRQIRKILSTILRWPCVVEEKGFSEVAKAQHGAIDCLAWMICAETQTINESVSDGDSHSPCSTKDESEISERLQNAEHPESKSTAGTPTLEITEDSASSRTRPLLEIIEESSFVQESAEENERASGRVHGDIQLIEKLPESEQLKTRPLIRKNVSLLSRELTNVEKAQKDLSGKRIHVLDRLSELEQESEDAFQEPQHASEASTSVDDVSELERSEQVSSERTGDAPDRQRTQTKSKLKREELPCLDQGGEQIEENLAGGVRQRGSKPKVLIEELSESEMSRKGGQANDPHLAVLIDVVSCLTGHVKKLPWSCVSGDHGLSAGGGLTSGSISVPVEFRICMANVLISACQKISLGARTTFAAKIVPPLTTFIEVSKDLRLKPACFQVLFTAVYHLKAPAMLPFAPDLMRLSLQALNSRAPFEERMGGVKLLASLLASEDVLVRELAPHFLDLKVALSSISAIDTSYEMRAFCEKLLSCLSVPGDDID
ncbi:hypothetical protein R1flu_015873 [Riccia fluitans]|uniref:ARM repeat superfamily protein n=1 Tax=Riccia fluitans TaxID=41844 RepID=A0ABD1YK96_9MARC